MANVLDVAAYILQEHGPMTTWKLQKLVYYGQAWSFVWDDDELFPEEIEAWANGPVVRELYNAHKGRFRVRGIGGGDSSRASLLRLTGSPEKPGNNRNLAEESGRNNTLSRVESAGSRFSVQSPKRAHF